MPHTNDNSVQSELLNRLRKTRRLVSVYLSNGVRLSGVTIESFDAYVLTIKRNNETQLVQKSAVSTVLPEAPKRAPRPQRPAELPPAFDRSCQEVNRPVTITVKRRILKARTD
jgi:host factor-I protein